MQEAPQPALDHFDVGLGVEQPGDAGMKPQRRFAGGWLQHGLISGIFQRDCQCAGLQQGIFQLLGRMVDGFESQLQPRCGGVVAHSHTLFLNPKLAAFSDTACLIVSETP